MMLSMLLFRKEWAILINISLLFLLYEEFYWFKKNNDQHKYSSDKFIIHFQVELFQHPTALLK